MPELAAIANGRWLVLADAQGERDRAHPRKRACARPPRPHRGAVRAGVPNHFTLIPANLITLAHFVVSAAMCLAKSSGVIGIGTPPRSAIRACNLASAS